MNSRIDHLPILILEPHARCNCRCVMCDIWKVTDAREITAAELARHLADIEALRVEWVVFTGGEPLMHSDLFRLCRMLRERAIRTTILSSGLLLGRHAGAIVAEVDDVIVSLDGPPAVHNTIRGVPQAFESLAAGVRAIHRLAPEFPASARCTVQFRNAGQLRATIDTARALGLGSISFLAADLTSAAFNRPQPWTAGRQSALAPDPTVIEREIEDIIAEYPDDGFILESPEKLRRIATRFGPGPPVAPRCNAPWVSAVVEASGNVRPCFFHAPIGNIANGTLREILNAPDALAFRESLNVAENETCRRCVCSLYRSDAASTNPEALGPLAAGR